MSATWGNRSSRKAPLPSDWKRRRRAVFTRDGYTCTNCGWVDPSGGTLECDHLGAPDDHSFDHLTTLCGRGTPSNCHGRKTSAAGKPTALVKRPPERHPGIR